jgi:hypothetical protein
MSSFYDFVLLISIRDLFNLQSPVQKYRCDISVTADVFLKDSYHPAKFNLLSLFRGFYSRQKNGCSLLRELHPIGFVYGPSLSR